MIGHLLNASPQDLKVSGKGSHKASQRGAALCSKLLIVIFLMLVIKGYAATNMPLRIQLHWSHQAQFAGYYVAESRQKGPTTIELLEGGPGIDPLDKLSKGEADVAIAWVAQALEARRKGIDIVNVAQVFTRPGIALAFNKKAGVKSARDLVGHSVGVWNVGDEISVRLWLQRKGVSESSVKLVQQAEGARDLITGKLQCGTVMLYNEYWTLLEGGFKSNDLLLVKLGDEGLGMLEDGIYAKGAQLEDPIFRHKITDFMKAAALGWDNARKHPSAAVALTTAKRPTLDPLHERRMLESILKLIPAEKPFGWLEPEEFERSVNIFADHAQDADGIRKAARNAWTHRICEEAGLKKIK